jgi:predicted outer membrane protein
MPITRTAAGTVFVAGGLILTLTALVYPSMLGVQTVSSANSRIIANTSAGPLTEADRDFVVKVRAAGLWELPSGELALKKGTTPAVRTAGQHLVNGHANLDAADRKVASELGITIPNQPSPQQQGFVQTLTADTGKKFDEDLANILRVTHGQIFTTIASIRETTRNTLVRQLADVANNTVLDHITVMEQTGLVNFDSVLFQETTPPKLPKTSVTPPVPQPGEPTVVLSPPAGFTPPPSTTPSGP